MSATVGTHLHSEKGKKSASGAGGKDQPFIPPDPSALSFLIQAGDFEQISHTTPSTCSFPFSFLFWFLVNGPPHIKNSATSLLIRNTCVISAPGRGNSHPRFCFILSLLLAVIESQRGNMRSPSFWDSFVFHPLSTDRQTLDCHWEMMPILAFVFCFYLSVDNSIFLLKIYLEKNEGEFYIYVKEKEGSGRAVTS
jgi:hypothetical protein